jgi:holo-[acyl-carrier protein] synthase
MMNSSEIVGIGIDLVEVERIERAATKRRTFLNKIYDTREIRLSERGVLRYEELAGRFAVKESILKVLKTGWRQGVRFNEIVILNHPSGAPYVELKGRAKEVAESLNIKEIHISISHTKDLAIGMAVATT